MKRITALIIGVSFAHASCVTVRCPPPQTASIPTGNTVQGERRSTWAASTVSGEKTAFELSLAASEAAARKAGAETIGVQSLAVGGAVTAGVYLFGLKSLLGDIDNLLKTASGEAQTVLLSLRSSVSNTIAEFERLLGDDLGHTLDKLGVMERTFVQDVERLINQSQRAVQAVAIEVSERSIQLVREADIAAYDTLYALPFRSAQPRVVYWQPKSYYNLGQTQLVEFRGNFLNVRPPRVWVDGKEGRLMGATSNATQVELLAPGEEGQQDELRRVEMEHAVCTPKTCLFGWCEPESSTTRSVATITMRPRVRYSLVAHIRPKGRQLERSSFSFSNYFSDNNCKANYHRPVEYCLADGWQLDGGNIPGLRITAANCGSGASSRPSGNGCVIVDAHVKGCGYNSFGLNCKGRGWIGYVQSVPAKRLREKTFDARTFERGSTTDMSFTFAYGDLPAESRIDDWEYQVDIEGTNGARVSLSHAQAVLPQAEARMAGGTLSVSILDPMLGQGPVP